jgi:hypothetical protein
MLVLDICEGLLAGYEINLTSNINTNPVTTWGSMTSQLEVSNWQLTKHSTDYIFHLYEKWLLSGNCPLTPAGNIRRQSEALPEQWTKAAWHDISPISFHQRIQKVLCMKQHEWNQRWCPMRGISPTKKKFLYVVCSNSSWTGHDMILLLLIQISTIRCR